MGILKIISIVYGVIVLLILSFAIGNFLIDYTFNIGLIAGIGLLPFTIGASLFPTISIVWFLESRGEL